MTSKYTTEEKEKLARKIGLIKNKEHLIKIGKIIMADKKCQGFTSNNNGSFTYFHILSDSTYSKIEKFINKIRKKKLDKTKSDTFSETATFDYQPYSQEEYQPENEFNTKLKYSNKEKNLIKRKLYDKAISESNEIVKKNNKQVSKNSSEKNKT